MKLVVNIEKRYAYVILGLLIILIGVVAVNAYIYAVPNPGHGADQVLISINGYEKTLQQAIDSGDFTPQTNNVNCNFEGRYIIHDYGNGNDFGYICQSGKVVRLCDAGALGDAAYDRGYTNTLLCNARR